MLQLNANSLTAQGKIIPAEEYQAYLDAQGIIAEAKKQAKQIIADAQQEYEDQKQQGFDDGLREGRMEMAEKMVDSVAKSVDYFSDLEDRMVELVVKALKKVVGEMDAHERIVAIVRHALAVTRNQSKVTIRACPTEVEVLQDKLADIMRPYPAINFIDIVPDTRLEVGGCILETDIGVVDASVDVQLNAIERSLAKSLAGEN